MPRKKATRTLFEEPVKEIELADYLADAVDCDLLLWEPTSWYGYLIAAGTSGQVSHITAVVREGGVAWSQGLEEKSGRGVAAPLIGEVMRWPGKISVFRVPRLTPEDREGVKVCLSQNLKASYGWPAIRAIVLGQLFFFRFLVWLPGFSAWYRGLFDRMENARQKTPLAICSSYIHRSFCDGCRRPVFVKKPSLSVTPNDIGRSSETVYVGTLVP